MLCSFWGQSQISYTANYFYSLRISLFFDQIPQILEWIFQVINWLLIKVSLMCSSKLQDSLCLNPHDLNDGVSSEGDPLENGFLTGLATYVWQPRLGEGSDAFIKSLTLHEMHLHPNDIWMNLWSFGTAWNKKTRGVIQKRAGKTHDKLLFLGGLVIVALRNIPGLMQQRSNCWTCRETEQLLLVVLFGLFVFLQFSLSFWPLL